jgi:ATPase subunit of ABC transporter with duplicated ATPase domains
LALSLILKRVTRRYADNLIFENVSLELHPTDRVALLGRNGSGKTTLMKLLTKLEPPDAGEVSVTGTVAYLEQRSELEAGNLREIVLPVRHRQLKTELEAAQQNLVHPSAVNLERFAVAEEHFRLAGGYDIEARAETILAGLGLSGERSSRALSGGQERRALLARLLIEPADFYLLDEPTNHLDLESLVWLEEFVNSSEAGFLIVSHDRAFLDATVTRCYELERQKLSEYPGNFTEAMEVKRVLREAAKVAFENHTRKVKQLEHEAQVAAQQASRSENRNRAGSRDKTTAFHLANRATHAMGRRTLALQKRIEHMGELEKPFEENFMTRIGLTNVNHGPNEILTIENLKLERGEKMILEDLNLHIRRGERLAFIGANGGGKSTLLKTILGQLPISNGSIVKGVGLNIYWAGQNTEELDEFETLKDALLAANPDLETRELFALLASLGLPKDPSRAIATLSGGQRTRLSLARLSVTRAHLLVLDEPTNNLDVDAIQALEKMLLEFPGTIIFASHDRRLLETVASKTLAIPSLKLEVMD